MLWAYFHEDIWFMIVIGVGGAVGRAAKAGWPTMPAWALPLLVIVFSYLLLFADLALEPSNPLDVDARVALWGILLGGAAVGGHETLKKLLTLAVSVVVKDEGRALSIVEALLGKLRDQATPPPARSSRRSVITTLLVACFLSLSLPSCTPQQRAAVADVLTGVSQGSAWLASAIDAGEAGAEVFYARHPNPRALADVKAYALVAREAQAALDGLIAVGGAVNEGDLQAAREAALQAYGHFRSLLDRLGVLDAAPPDGGAEADGVPEPRPLSLPTVQDLGARL